MSVLVVTGGSLEIGAAIAKKAARKGWACCINFAKDENGAQAVV